MPARACDRVNSYALYDTSPSATAMQAAIGGSLFTPGESCQLNSGSSPCVFFSMPCFASESHTDSSVRRIYHMKNYEDFFYHSSVCTDDCNAAGRYDCAFPDCKRFSNLRIHASFDPAPSILPSFHPLPLTRSAHCLNTLAARNIV